MYYKKGTVSHNSHQPLRERREPLRVWNRIGVLAFFVSLSACVFAAEIKGTVTNATTNKPAAGDEVVILSLEGGMDEVGRGKTDAQGRFTVSIPASNAPHLVRVIHQGVNYHTPAPEGTTSVDVTVWDAAKQVDNIIGEGRVVRVLNASPQQIEIAEMYILRNESQPPRTRMGERSFEFGLPDGAQVEEGMAAGPSGMPINTDLTPTGKKNRYAFSFPIRPGRTQLQVTYKLPYNGSHDFMLETDMPLAELGVMLPKSMRFNNAGETFRPAADEGGMAVFVAKSVAAGAKLKFSIAGEGTAPTDSQSAGSPASAESGRPGGGLGAPIDAPDPLNGSRWYIIGTMAAVFAGGAFLLWRRSRSAPLQPSPEVIDFSTVGARSSRAGGVPTTAPQAGLLDAIKDELFQLETDRLQGKISQQEYEAAKRGLETLLGRQMKKQDYPQRA